RKRPSRSIRDVSEPLTLDEFAARTDTPVEDVERYRAAGLLDPEGDGSFDAVDAVRLNFLRQYEALGGSLDKVHETTLASLFAPPRRSEPPDDASLPVRTAPARWALRERDRDRGAERPHGGRAGRRRDDAAPLSALHRRSVRRPRREPSRTAGSRCTPRQLAI